MAKGIHVATWDPHIDFGQYPEGVEIVSNIGDANDFDIAVLVTAHKACVNLDWENLLGQMRTPLLYDGRGEFSIWITYLISVGKLTL